MSFAIHCFATGAKVVSKMGFLEQSDHDCNAILSKSKIPDYARDYRNEYLLEENIKKYIEEVIMG